MMKRATLIYLSAVLLIMSSCQKSDEATSKFIEESKQYYEANATVISLPMQGTTQTKAFDSSLGDVYPEWEKAIESGCGCAKMVEVPLSGTIRVVGTITKITDGKIKRYRSTTMSYLVLDYGGLDTPKMYVETFIEKGKSCTMTARSSKGEATGFVIISDMSGAITEVKGYHEGLAVGINRTTPDVKKVAERGHDFFGFGMAYEAVRKTRSGYCPHGIRYFCPFCGRVYYETFGVDPICPECSERYYSFFGTEYCPTCGKPWYQCACENPAGSCPPCGRNSNNCSAGCQYEPGSGHNGICTCE